MHVPGLNVPFSGRFYFRTMLYGFINVFTHRINSQCKPVVFYLHPRKIDPEQPRLNLSRWDALIHYYRISHCRAKREHLLEKFSCESIGSVLQSDFYLYI
ncbi:DUF3473 domain-containing protein [Oscillibacter sp.]|uniref:DUF3473 domain-containing protein n=1 Tax=Oscillibacter sp. TaxID=1945593 RepID=UPI00345BF05F